MEKKLNISTLFRDYASDLKRNLEVSRTGPGDSVKHPL